MANANCTATHLTSALKPLDDAFGLKKVFVVSMQSVSGAGYPGVSTLDILDNVIPYIGNEEPKLEEEPRKMLGTLAGDHIDYAGFVMSAHCNRVATLDGHLECVSVALRTKATPEQAAEVLRSYRSLPQEMGLPTAPDPASSCATNLIGPRYAWTAWPATAWPPSSAASAPTPSWTSSSSSSATTPSAARREDRC